MASCFSTGGAAQCWHCGWRLCNRRQGGVSKMKHNWKLEGIFLGFKRQPTVPNESFVSSIVSKEYAIVSGARFIVLRLWRQTATRWILETFQSFQSLTSTDVAPLWSCPLEDPAWRAVCQVGRGASKTAVWCYRFFSLAVRTATFFKSNNLMQFAGPASTLRNLRNWSDLFVLIRLAEMLARTHEMQLENGRRPTTCFDFHSISEITAFNQPPQQPIHISDVCSESARMLCIYVFLAVSYIITHHI